MLAKAHAKLGDADLEKIVDGNAPFELKPDNPSPPPGRGRVREGVETSSPGQQKPYRRGVLLTHGLTSSPYTMRYLAKFFQENGFRVMVVLLPGHGTQSGDLLDVKWQEWAKTVAYGAHKLAEEVDELYLAGYSIGGALSIYHSLRDKRVRGLFLFSPAFRITRWAALANLHKLYSWLYPSAKWVDVNPDRDIYKYESLAKNAAAQTYALTKGLKARLRQHELDIPVFAVASEDDTTVDASATIEFMASTRHPSSKLVLYTTDPERLPVGIAPQKLERVNSVVPEQRILSSAHTAIVMPPDDPHYGAQGEYSNCIHYYQDNKEKYHACINNPATDLQGEITEKNLKAGIMRRLTYNQNFTGLKVSMKKFIDGL